MASDTKRKGGFSLSDEDAIDVGLFASGPARITGSEWARYDYGGNAKPTPVWLVTFERGKGKEREVYEQPYGIGKGWDIGKNGELIARNGQTGLPKSCNAIEYLIKPLRKALAKADIDDTILTEGDPTCLVGLEGAVARVEQMERNIKDTNRKPRDENNPRTILVIDSVDSVAWESGSGGGKKKTKKVEADDKAEPADDDDEDDEDEKPAKKSAKGAASKKAKPADDDDDETEAASDNDDVTEEAVEAIVAIVERGKVKFGDELELKLEKLLKGHKQAAGIIDLATSKKFLQREQGWSFDGKTIDAAE